MKSLGKYIAPLLIACCSIVSNNAYSALVSADFNWQGDQGYKASGTFIYDDSLPLITAKGKIYETFNHGLNYLEISFYDPSNSLLFNTIDVQDGIVSYDFLLFTFNPSTMTFEDLFDMGEYTETSESEYYVWGQMGSTDSFLERSDGETLDSQALPLITVTPASIPVPASFVLFSTALLGLFGLRKLA